MDSVQKSQVNMPPLSNHESVKDQILVLCSGLAIEKQVNTKTANAIYNDLTSHRVFPDIRKDISSLALLFIAGEVIEQDQRKAFDLYKLAADLGDMVATFQVVEMYKQGVGVEPNEGQAKIYSSMAAEQQNKRAFDGTKSLADQGHIPSMLMVADMYQHGNGVEKSEQKGDEYHKAFYEQQKLIEKEKYQQVVFETTKFAADNGDWDSILQLSDMYRRGEGVAKDEKLAERYLQLAMVNCKPTDAERNYEVGIRYFKKAQEIEIGVSGKSPGAKSHYEKALSYFKIAAKNKHAEAHFYLWHCHQLILPYTPDAKGVLPKEAFVALATAVELKSANAMGEIGKMYWLIHLSPREALDYINVHYKRFANAKQLALENSRMAADAKVSGAASFLFSLREYFSLATDQAKALLETAVYQYKLPSDLFEMGRLQLVGDDPLIEKNLEEGFNNWLHAVQRANELGDPYSGVYISGIKSIEEMVLSGVNEILQDKKRTWDMRACAKLGELLTVIKTITESRDKAAPQIQRVDRLLVQQQAISKLVTEVKPVDNKIDPFYGGL